MVTPSSPAIGTTAENVQPVVDYLCAALDATSNAAGEIANAAGDSLCVVEEGDGTITEEDAADEAEVRAIANRGNQAIPDSATLLGDPPYAVELTLPGDAGTLRVNIRGA